MRVVMNDLSLDDMPALIQTKNVQAASRRSGFLGTDGIQRVTLCCTWNSIRHCFDDYARAFARIAAPVMKVLRQESRGSKKDLDDRRMDSWNQQRRRE